MKQSVTLLSTALLALTLVAGTAGDAAAAPKGGAKQAPKAQAAAEPKKDGGKKSELGERLSMDEDEKNLPLFVKSDTLTLDSKARIFTYRGNVEASKGTMTITAEVMIGEYDEDSRIETLTALGNVVITKGDAMRATANRAVYNVAAARIELTEGPEIVQQGNALSADKVTLFVNEDRSEAEGEVRVKVLKGAEGDPLRAVGEKGK